MPEHSRGNENEKEKENNPIIHAKSLDEQCHGLYDRVSAFLAEDAQSQLLRNVQEQSRTSLGAIEEALRRYRYVPGARCIRFRPSTKKSGAVVIVANAS